MNENTRCPGLAPAQAGADIGQGMNGSGIRVKWVGPERQTLHTDPRHQPLPDSQAHARKLRETSLIL